MKNIYRSLEAGNTFYPYTYYREERMVKYMGKGHTPKPHWKKLQSEEERQRKLKAAEEKRQRKLEKREKNEKGRVVTE